MTRKYQRQTRNAHIITPNFLKMPKEIDVEKIFSNKKLSSEEEKYAKIFETMKQNKPEKKSLPPEQKETLKTSLLWKYDLYHPKKSRFFTLRLVFNIGIMACLLIITYMWWMISNTQYNSELHPVQTDFPSGNWWMNFNASPVLWWIKWTNSTADISIDNLLGKIYLFITLLLLLSLWNWIYDMYNAKDNIGKRKRWQKKVIITIILLIIIWIIYSFIKWILMCLCI